MQNEPRTQLKIATDDWLHIAGLDAAINPRTFGYVPNWGNANSMFDCANGTLFAVSEPYLLACILCPHRRMLAFSMVPLAEAHGWPDGMIALDAPPHLNTAMTNFKGKELTFQFDQVDSRMTIRFPSARTMKISFPANMITGHVFAPLAFKNKRRQFGVDVREFLLALTRVNHRCDSDSAYPGVMTLCTAPDHLSLWNSVGHMGSHYVFNSACATGMSQECQFCFQADNRLCLERILKNLKRRSEQLSLWMDEKLLIFGTENDSVLFYGDIPPGYRHACRCPLAPANNCDHLVLNDCALVESRRQAEQICGLLRTTATDPFVVPPVRWKLTPSGVELIVRNASIEMPLCADAEPKHWTASSDEIEFDVAPEITIALLRAMATVKGPHSILYRRSRMILQSGAERFEIETRVDVNVRKRRSGE